MKYPIDKYRFYSFTDTDGRQKVKAVSTYAGKRVVGVASCHPNDEFNLENGKRLAALRCAEKISHKRMKRAQKQFAEAEKQMAEAQRYYFKMATYLADSKNEYDLATEELNNLMKNGFGEV